jgi:hypothetical protein
MASHLRFRGEGIRVGDGELALNRERGSDGRISRRPRESRSDAFRKPSGQISTRSYGEGVGDIAEGLIAEATGRPKDQVH